MKKLLILLVENPSFTLSENTLSDELTSEQAVLLSNHLGDETISEVYPADQKYEMAFAVYSQSDIKSLKSKFGDFCRILTSKAKTIGQFISDIAKKEKNAENIIFLKSNVSGLSEENINNFFTKLDENNIILGQSGDNSFYLLGFNKNISDELSDLTDIKESSLESLTTEKHILIHHLPEFIVVENVNNLSKLRDSISDKSSLAITIDKIVLGKDRTRHIKD